MKYGYSYEVNKLKPLKIIMLAISFLIDLLIIAAIPSLFFDTKIIIVFVLSICFNLALKISTIFLTYTIEYSYSEGRLEITKKYYREKKCLLSVDKKEIIGIEKAENVTKEDRLVSNYNCLYEDYKLKLKDKEYIISLDKTLIAFMLCEEKYDLFR